MEAESPTGTILVIGASGQVGEELTEALCKSLGPDNVIASDIRKPETAFECRFTILDALDKKGLFDLIEKENISQIYHLAAVLSAKGEKDPELAWRLNMTGLLNALEAARHTGLERLFWPSSIAAFGPNSPKENTPQFCVMDPNTVYGISKLAGERWCEYYAMKYGVDVRSIRYPGLISYKAEPGGGTTDYAIHIFYEAVRKGRYTCFLSEENTLPMMYMPDAIRATLELMEAPADKIRIRSSYNLAGVSFSPVELAEELAKHLPGFECNYEPDFRHEIADSWPRSIDDSVAAKDWGWKPEFGLEEMTLDMFTHIRAKFHEEKVKG
jgi:nucleoside-diphosphate-sugar epimerase